MVGKKECRLPDMDCKICKLWYTTTLYGHTCYSTGSPSSKYVVYAAACVYRELYGKINHCKKLCKSLNNYLNWNKVFLPQMCRELISCADFKAILTTFSEVIWNRYSSKRMERQTTPSFTGQTSLTNHFLLKLKGKSPESQ